MIISASRRTDIPAFFSDWFINRLKEGYVLVKNPMNANQVNKIILRPETCDCIVFWTKSPMPIISKLSEIEKLGYVHYYFQFTLNPYEKTIEKNLPSKDLLIKAFIELSNRIGKERVIWRYDPIILNTELGLTKEYHYKEFERLVRALDGKTDKCIISFLDKYKNISSNTKDSNIALKAFDTHNPNHQETMIEMTQRFIEIIKKSNASIKLECCAEPILLTVQGMEQAHCVDLELIKKITKKTFDRNALNKQVYQRKDCGCAKSYDIGAVNTCLNNCIYCYATNTMLAQKNNKLYQKESNILCSDLDGQETIYIKDEAVGNGVQQNFFE